MEKYCTKFVLTTNPSVCTNLILVYTFPFSQVGGGYKFRLFCQYIYKSDLKLIYTILFRIFKSFSNDYRKYVNKTISIPFARTISIKTFLTTSTNSNPTPEQIPFFLR